MILPLRHPGFARSLPDTMLIVISPAKTLDFETPCKVRTCTQPAFLEDSALLVDRLRELGPAQLAELMSISDALAALNVARYAGWATPFTLENARQAVLAFDGDVYDGLDAWTLTARERERAQATLRILSGLYGVLRPLDLIQPYRLEMGTRLANPRGRDLYAFWGERIARTLAGELDGMRHPVLVNLASDEYFKAVAPGALGQRVVKPVFQERKGAQWKVVSFHAKRARGLMARYALQNRVEDPERLKAFDLEGYGYAPQASDADTWVFRREA